MSRLYQVQEQKLNLQIKKKNKKLLGKDEDRHINIYKLESL
jgi:hypothetical protein